MAVIILLESSPSKLDCPLRMTDLDAADSQPVYDWIQQPEAGIFLERLNRFACLVELAGVPVKVYLPNSGRLEELLQPGAKVIVEHRRQQGKTHHDLLLIETSAYPNSQPIWAALDSRLPPKLFRFVLEHSLIDEFSNWAVRAMEPPVAGGRLDLLLSSGEQQRFVETKSVNLVDSSGAARFPDAPTERGRRHLQELARLRQAGHQASIVFIVGRHDAQSMAPFVTRDPEFHQALQDADAAGVDIHALAFEVGPSIQLRGSLPVDLTPPVFPGYWPELASAYTE